jgi:hypothetical protein
MMSGKGGCRGNRYVFVDRQTGRRYIKQNGEEWGGGPVDGAELVVGVNSIIQLPGREPAIIDKKVRFSKVWEQVQEVPSHYH